MVPSPEKPKASPAPSTINSDSSNTQKPQLETMVLTSNSSPSAGTTMSSYYKMELEYKLGNEQVNHKIQSVSSPASYSSSMSEPIGTLHEVASLSGYESSDIELHSLPTVMHSTSTEINLRYVIEGKLIKHDVAVQVNMFQLKDNPAEVIPLASIRGKERVCLTAKKLGFSADVIDQSLITPPPVASTSTIESKSVSAPIFEYIHTSISDSSTDSPAYLEIIPDSHVTRKISSECNDEHSFMHCRPQRILRSEIRPKCIADKYRKPRLKEYQTPGPVEIQSQQNAPALPPRPGTISPLLSTEHSNQDDVEINPISLRRYVNDGHEILSPNSTQRRRTRRYRKRIVSYTLAILIFIVISVGFGLIVTIAYNALIDEKNYPKLDSGFDIGHLGGDKWEQ
ncbi:hypothetical protein PV328_008650 [Microctonus aethiopoides]|uniref:Uncharacterized protein n=1 Tax=Microctonus aethiopoides TaxID=144406 RepID=A0AA39FJU7_9HYME|nr:hypothetical protein PV328_008650 [Microctonus aethiopoides]